MHRVHHLLSHLRSSLSNRNCSTSSNVGTFGIHDAGAKTQYNDDDLHYNPNAKDKTLTYWERKIDALKVLMQSKKYWTIPESRRTIEGLPKYSYTNIAYYEKWMYATLTLCLKKGVFTEEELLTKYQQHPMIQKLHNRNNSNSPIVQKFKKGDKVQVRNVLDNTVKYESWRLFLGLIGHGSGTHVRSPGYIINKIGIIQSYEGLYENDELKSLGINETKVSIYRVRFKRSDIFKDKSLINNNDTVDIEILSHWLKRTKDKESNIIIDHHHDHGRSVSDHIHKDRDIVERNAIDKEPELSPYEIISEVVIDILTKKNIITMNELREFMERVDRGKKFNLVPKIVIKYWKDDNFRNNLLRESESNNAYRFLAKEMNAKHLLRDIFTLKVMVNTDKIHNVIVCTLCSCYPRTLLGIPPPWYKSLKYRSEMINNPRKLLKNEFGCKIDDDMILRVYDSTSDIRYIVIPHLPSQIPGWETMPEKELEKRITRDMIVGVKR